MDLREFLELAKLCDLDNFICQSDRHCDMIAEMARDKLEEHYDEMIERNAKAEAE